MSGTGNVTGIQWKCDNCFTEFNNFKALLLHRQQHCFPDRLNRKRKQISQKKIRFDSLQEEYDNSNQKGSNKNSKEISFVSKNDSSTNNLLSSSCEYVDDDDMGSTRSDNFHDPMDSSSPLPLIQLPVLLPDNNSMMVNNKYISFQRKFLSLVKPPKVNNNDSSIDNDVRSESGLATHLSLGRVASISSGHFNQSPGSSKITTGYANPTDVLNIFIFVKTNYMSENEGNALLYLIIQLFRNHPPIEDFFLHRNMRSINKALNRAMDSLYSANEIHCSLPIKLRGSDLSQMNKIDRILNHRNKNPQLILASGIGMDIMEVISEFLVSHDFDYFDFLPIMDIKNGQRHYSTFTSAKLYHQVYKETQDLCGMDVIPICFQIAQDGTPIQSGGVGNKSITPVHMRILNVKNKESLNDENNCSLIGFAPSFTVSMIIIIIKYLFFYQ
jgi:hypothetical protein